MIMLCVSEGFSVRQDFLDGITELHFHGKSRTVTAETFPSPDACHVRII